VQKGRSIFLAAILACASAAAACAELKDYIFIVKPVYHEKTRALFHDLARYFADKGNSGAESYFTTMAGEYAHGTGWIVVDQDGQNYIVTNRHVVIGAEKVNIYLENQDGTQKAFADCPILYVDAQMDLAVCQFPGAQRVFKTGFKLDLRQQKDLTEVVAAGFPGFGGKPLWQVSLGTITNSQARIDTAYSYLIQHSAPIDPGNSGGPLLVRDPSAPQGFAVAGVNTLKALKRESTSFAIPARNVAEVLDRARKAKKLAASPKALRSELIRSCNVLAGELNSDNPVDQDVNQHISYAIVGEKGWQAYQGVLATVKDQTQFADWFLDDPVEAMRTSIFWFFSAEVDRQSGAAIEFDGINPADEGKISGREGIRTNFAIGGKPKEIEWSLEYGQWRISNMSLDLPPGTEADPGLTPASASAAQSSPPGAQSFLALFGYPGPYLGFDYTGFPWPPVRIGLSAGAGYLFDGSLFVSGGPALSVIRGLALPLRVGVAVTPQGTTFLIDPGILFLFSGLTLGVDFGYMLSGSVIIGIGLGINWPAGRGQTGGGDGT